jgi:hypothetical protein
VAQGIKCLGLVLAGRINPKLQARESTLIAVKKKHIYTNIYSLSFKIFDVWGVMFWLLGVYAFYILKYIFDIFQNIKIIETKNSHVHLHMLHAHKVIV